jgi:hypothetical protein
MGGEAVERFLVWMYLKGKEIELCEFCERVMADPKASATGGMKNPLSVAFAPRRFRSGFGISAGAVSFANR